MVHLLLASVRSSFLFPDSQIFDFFLFLISLLFFFCAKYLSHLEMTPCEHMRHEFGTRKHADILLNNRCIHSLIPLKSSYSNSQYGMSGIDMSNVVSKEVSCADSISSSLTNEISS